MIGLGLTGENPVKGVEKRKETPKAHEGYSIEELVQVFKIFEETNRNLYLCARLMFHAFLRPHRECRLIQRKHIDFEHNRISVPASIRKGADAFILPLHPDLKATLLQYGALELAPNDFIVYADNPSQHLGPDYFKVLWTRLKPQLLASGVIRKQQTLYSIRHTAACLYYMKTKDPEELQRLMAHRDLETTLIYLRSLGMYTKPISADNLPKIGH